MPDYRINTIYPTIQGEGALVGTPMVLVRFAGCNLRCTSAGPAGFDCDTEFVSQRPYSLEAIVAALADYPTYPWILLTGGEPALQVDAPLVKALRETGRKLALETNGMLPVPDGIDWICCSPKTAEHTLKLVRANELKYVRRHGQGVPVPQVTASEFFISPVCQADGSYRRDDLAWCRDLCAANPPWRLTLQWHKLLGWD